MDQNLRNRPAIENVVSKITDRLLRIDWTNQRSGSAGTIDAIKADAEEAVAAGIKFPRANVERGRARRRNS